ncbi:uncharacterized protein LY89DRAFT_326117 [Mollisia scopiformis]|uniref:Uncharacterized protein n=1 Tax=Mollisia scopiformis TaxID=149040 RepID=A0A132B8Q4_MOLSC|nr:uncharacterized protein LY89DRAFT_326117 [Mollisia scopiformis]KUJ08776.1 hypothetical protein LY89DRAFT_326117 [Mollisia scopiformis]
MSVRTDQWSILASPLRHNDVISLICEFESKTLYCHPTACSTIMFRSIFFSSLAFGILANAASCDSNTTSSVHHKQHLALPFESRGQAGVVSITVQPNDDVEHAFGLDLLYPGTAILPNFIGFPVVHADMTYPIPSSPYSGYGTLFGWIQFIRQDDDGVIGNWTVDHYPFAQDIDTPFGYWGYNPSTFDAPAILLDEGNNTSIVWTAQAFLTILPDAGGSKNVSVIPGGAFTWGFDINVDANSTTEREIVIRRVEQLDVSGWSGRVALLREQYPEWTFQDVE